MGNGLSAAIMNPYSLDMMKAYYTFCALKGLDDNCSNYITFAESLPKANTVTNAGLNTKNVNIETSENKKETDVLQNGVGENGKENRAELQNAIIKGLKERASVITKDLLGFMPPLQIVQEEIIPALNEVGTGFEKKTVYLPQLLMSAEAAKCAFEQIKLHMPSEKSADKCRFVIATVKGDIHDIGKNIVKLLLENYGFEVTDLGRDVSPETIIESVIALHAPLVGLSALMTTTVPAMEETICKLREQAPWCKVVVGGAVLTQEYADAIGADKYAKDAMETVRFAEEVNRFIKI